MKFSVRVAVALCACCIALSVPAPVVAQEWESESFDPYYEAPYALSVDDSGYVYLTYTGYGNDTTGWGYTTTKYSQDGDTAWVRHYHGAHEHEDDIASAQVVDHSGNVYVTGTSWGDGTFADYATVKYSPTGDTIWTRRFDGSSGEPWSGNDSALALAVDDVGNAYVTGGAWFFGSFTLGYATIKYSPEGDTLWVRTYDGVGEDVAYAVAVAGDGTVYVSGTSGTIKYSPIGDTLWTRPGIAGLALVLDDSGYVYLTGGSATWKLAPNGDTIWTGIGGVALTVDSSGFVYTTGGGTVGYSSSGDTLWTRHNVVGSALQVDGDGNVYVAGRYGLGGPTPFLGSRTIKYSPVGDSLWLARTGNAGGPCGSWSEYRGLAVDDSGDVYMVEVSLIGIPIDMRECRWMYGASLLKYAKPVCPISLDGDVNGDQSITAADVIDLVNFSFKGGASPLPCAINGDVNCTGLVTSTDIIYLVNYVFKGGAVPCDICQFHVGWFWECP